MALATTGYLNTKGIPLEALKKVVKAQLFAKIGKMALLDSDSNVIDHYEGPMLFRELVNTLGKREGFERILDEKVRLYPDKSPGNKYLTKGSSTKGYTPIGFDPKDIPNMTGKIIVNAGLADGYRLHEFTGLPVACAVGEANIPKIVAELKTAISVFNCDIKLISTADNDKAGLRACVKSGVDWVVPKTDNDWSDVYQNRGGQAVIDQFADLQGFVPIYLVDETLEKMGLSLKNEASASGRAVPSSNQFLIRENPESFAGVQIGIRIRNPKAVESLEQYVSLARAIGCYREHEGNTAFLSSDMAGHALMMSLLHDGLHPSLGQEDRRFADAFSRRVLLAAHAGEMDTVEPLEGAPVIAHISRSDSQGLVLSLSSAMDEKLIRFFKSLETSNAGWVKERKRWEFSLPTAADFNAWFQEIESHLDGRLAVLLPESRGGRFMAYSASRLHELLEHFKADLSWLNQEAIIKAPPRQASNITPASIEVSLCSYEGWNMIRVTAPNNHREHLKEGLGRFNPIYREGSWYVPLSKRSVDYVIGLQPKWVGSTPEEMKDVQREMGFGIITYVGGDRFMVKSPYSSKLVDQIKSELPKMARRYDAELGCWEIHVASGAIGSVLQEIAKENDFRVFSSEGGRLPEGCGYDSIVPQQVAKKAAEQTPRASVPKQPVTHRSTATASPGR